LQQTQQKDNNYNESNSNITYNNSNAPNSKLGHISELGKHKEKGMRSTSQQEKKNFYRKKTYNNRLIDNIPEEDCSPLKDKTTFHTPSELMSNGGDQKVGGLTSKNISNNTIITMKENIVKQLKLIFIVTSYKEIFI